ncbi:MAG: hypothetical protein AB8B69_09635 [Chitinophagales bacterium]
MKIITFFSIFLSFLFYNVSFAQSSGIVIATSVENRDIAYFNESNSIDSHNFNIGIDKCFGGNLVLYTGFRYTKSNGKHTCSQCGIYSSIEREVITNSSPKSYYRYEESVEKIGVPISLKYYIPSNNSVHFFAEGGALFNFFNHGIWEGEYWENDVATQTAILGPFEVKDEGTKVGVVDITGIAAIGIEADIADWAVILKPYAQYTAGYWALGGMIGVKRVFEKR